jgi:hypothetical protein
MKNTTIKIEVNKEGITTDFLNFLAYNQDSIQTKKRLVKKENNQYWCITLKMKADVNHLDLNDSKFRDTDEQLLKCNYETKIKKHINNNTISERLKNCLNRNMETLEFVQTINDFKHIKGIGEISINRYKLFLADLLEIKTINTTEHK